MWVEVGRCASWLLEGVHRVTAMLLCVAHPSPCQPGLRPCPASHSCSIHFHLAQSLTLARRMWI